MIRPGDDRPTILVDSNSDFRRTPVLVRYNPVAPAERPDDAASADQAWPSDADNASDDADVDDDTLVIEAPVWIKLVTGMQLRSGRQWSAELIKGQIVVALERFRPQEVVTIDSFLLRGDDAYEIGSTNISTGDNARWALFPWRNDIGLLVSPTPLPDPSVDQTNLLPSLAFLAGLDLDGQAMFQNEQGQSLQMPISEKQPTTFEGNADLVIQIMAFITAMIMMVMFYRRAPQQDQLDLPDHLVLASFGRRAMAGVIDLTPGFILAGLIYNVSVGQVILESWPGNGIEKAFVAMRPGFVVIGVTLLHTTITEFILARSLGKILMGMYVSDLNGKPAPPMPCLGRALSRAFELFAPLMILVAVISPARQRLGDILAKTTVVMRKPEEIEDEDD
ncbi:MAG: RDD family protein [Phycisphaeraceae bacterium]